MTTLHPIHTLPTKLEESTVDLSELRDYLYGMPRYLEAGMQEGVSDKALHWLSHTDSVEYWLRRYLLGKPATLHRVFYEIRDFQKCSPSAACTMTQFVLNVVKATLMEQEWFELLPRYEYARKRIEKTFQI